MTTAITIVGGVYVERCVWPDWDQVYGSAGRAAVALSGHVHKITLQSYAAPEITARFAPAATLNGFRFDPVQIDQAVSFEYVHSLSVPVIRPSLSQIRKNRPITVAAEVVLRFGMLEGSANVKADRCIYDPQSAFAPEPFAENGSTANHLAIVGNRAEILALGGGTDPVSAAQSLLRAGAEVVVVKAGVEGAYVVDAKAVLKIPAYRTQHVWTVGSGDVFAAIFAAYWGVHGLPPLEAAQLGSSAVAAYANSMALPVPSITQLRQPSWPAAASAGGRAYIASPFFTIGQRWLVDEARRCLIELGMSAFSPVHDVGWGPAAEIAPADLAGIDECDLVFALIDGLDSGTLFELGYARARGKPVYALAQAVSDEDLKMVVGSGCNVYPDFVTALHQAAWRT